MTQQCVIGVLQNKGKLMNVIVYEPPLLLYKVLSRAQIKPMSASNIAY